MRAKNAYAFGEVGTWFLPAQLLMIVNAQQECLIRMVNNHGWLIRMVENSGESPMKNTDRLALLGVDVVLQPLNIARVLSFYDLGLVHA